MIRRHMIMGAAMATLALASCGGSNDDDASPTPTPTTSPTPTPTASPTYTAFPLAAAAEFSTISATTSYTGNPDAGAVTLGVPATEMLSSRVRLATSNAIDTAEYVIRENTEESRFKKANLTTAPAPTAPEFVFRINDATTLGKFSQVEFLNNTIPPATTGGAAVITNDTGLQFTQLSYANWWRGDSAAGAKRLAYTVFGYPTVLTDMPTAATQAYTSRVNGRLISVAGGATTISRVGGTATVSVNFATGLVSVTMTLTTTNTAGATTPYGTFTAQGGIGVGNNQFTGSFRSGSPLDGTMAGGFFGSQAKEIGIAFAGSGTFNGADQRLVGEVVGKK